MDGFAFVQAMLESAVAEGIFPAAAAAWGRGDRDPEYRYAGEANADTLFDVASLSKILGPTMLALKGLENGLLTLEDTVGDFLPAPPDKAGIKLRQLLTHTAGFEPTYRLDETVSDPALAAEDILRRPLQSSGGAPVYSCIGFILLGMMLEARFAKPLDTLVRDEVFIPLGMGRTGYGPLTGAAAGACAPTEADPVTGVAWRGTVHDENARFLGGVSGNAGIFSDIRDMARFAFMLAQGGGDYLKPATLRAAIVNRTPGYPERRGLGFQLAGPETFFGDLFPDSAFGHTGFTGTSLAVDPETGFYVVLLTNRVHPTRENVRHLRFRRALHNRMYAALSRK
ncbi:MAG: beta-lactamase family protein [Clostridia bacterium]|nr:beta-lactamase family protein [Clostridia bacterium]